MELGLDGCVAECFDYRWGEVGETCGGGLEERLKVKGFLHTVYWNDRSCVRGVSI